jgi:hypothetical protein
MGADLFSCCNRGRSIQNKLLKIIQQQEPFNAGPSPNIITNNDSLLDRFRNRENILPRLQKPFCSNPSLAKIVH